MPIMRLSRYGNILEDCFRKEDFMIRVLQVVTHMNRGGLETMLMNYYRHIDRTQVQFDFLTHREYDGDYGEEIKTLGGIIYHLPVLNPFSNSYKAALRSFFKEHPEYQIVHVHQDCLSSVILKEAKKCKVPVRIAHSHNSSQDKNIKYPIKMFWRLFIPKYATDLLACSNDAGKWMFRGEDFSVLNNAIDAELYKYSPQRKSEQRTKLGILENELVVGHVGRFSPAKNHAFLLDIFYEIRKQIPSKFLLVGDGELRSDIEKKIADLKLQDRVILTGVRDDVADLLQAMDVFVFPSHYEGLPVTMIEAQAAGLPCLISDKVPIECKKTDLVRQLPLSAGAKVWATAVIDAAKTDRLDTYSEIKNAGFDIAENARKLQKYYLNAAIGEKGCLY